MPEVNYKIEGGGTVEEGVLRGDAGAEVELRGKTVDTILRVEKHPDGAITIQGTGTFELVSKGASKLEISGGAGVSLLDGTKTISGSVVWTISKHAAVEVRSQFGTAKPEFGAHVTVTF